MPEATPMAVKAEVIDDEPEHDPFAFVFQAAPPVGIKSEMGRALPQESFPPAAMPTAIVAEEPAPKKRKVKGALEAGPLSKLLQGMHLALQQITKPPSKPETAVNGFEDQLRKYWRTHFDVRAMGDNNMVGFMRRFPSVFNMKNNGVELVVSPMEAPDFDKAAEAGIEPIRGPSEHACKFSAGMGEHVLALIVNLFAEEKKAGGHALHYQYAPFAVCEDFLTRIQQFEDGLDDDVTKHLLDTICDPRPQPPARAEQNTSWDSHDRRDDHQWDRKDQDRDWRDNRDWRNRDDGPRGRGPNFYDRHSGHDDRDRERYDDRRDNRPKQRDNREYRSDVRGSDGRSLCRQYQYNKCTYGDQCRFLHEYAKDQ